MPKQFNFVSNKELRDLLGEDIPAFLDRHPDARVVSVFYDPVGSISTNSAGEEVVVREPAFVAVLEHS